MGYNTYLKLDGIGGDCVEESHRGWITVDSFTHTLSGQQGQHGPTHLGDVSIAKFVDRTTPLLARATMEGRLFREATIEMCRADDPRAKFMALKLANVKVSMHSISGGPQGDMRTPFENFGLTVEKIEWFYYPSAFEPKAEGEVRAGWSSPAGAVTA
ncbi:MAG: type VI secretion system tube protein Hcp [Planctomycetaceae bacterium]|nr:type VI secretion system tube protein Hcp [Planctomycetaceae bacterium]